MRIPARALVVLALLMALPHAAPQQPAPQGTCGDIVLIFMNPDLQPRDDGYVHPSGQFFIQFQAIGPRASEVRRIAFSYGLALPDGTPQCEVPAGEPLTGAYTGNFRVDDTPEDGFFVPVNSTIVPNGQYGAAITAYDASGNYLARYFNKVLIENGPECLTASRCIDRTQPWPIVLPGDGTQTNGVEGMTIEFAEAVAAVYVKVNGQQVVPEPWVPPPRDADAVPENEAQDCGPFEGLPTVYDRSNAVCHRAVWGPGFRVPQAPGPGDVVEVRALDASGNEVTKIVSIGGATQGGAIELSSPELQLTTDAAEQDTETGRAAAYELRLVNVGQGDAEARMSVAAADGIHVTWDPPTVGVPTAGEARARLEALPAEGLRPGTYTLLVKAVYKSGTQDREAALPLTLRVAEARPVPASPLREERVNATTLDEEAPGGQAPRATPGAGALAFAVLAAAAVLLAKPARSAEPRRRPFAGPRARRKD